MYVELCAFAFSAGGVSTGTFNEMPALRVTFGAVVKTDQVISGEPFPVKALFCAIHPERAAAGVELFRAEKAAIAFEVQGVAGGEAFEFLWRHNGFATGLRLYRGCECGTDRGAEEKFSKHGVHGW